MKADLRKLLRRVLDSADSDWWAERADMTRKTPYEITIEVGLLWDIAEALTERGE